MIFDDSGSVAGASDPIGNRYEEADIGLNHFARRCRCQADLVAIRHFDIGTSGDVGPLPLDRHGLPELRQALSPPGGGGSSSLGPCLAAAEQLAAGYQDRPVTLAVFSDFELTDAHPSEILTRFAGWSFGPVHAVVLRAAPPDHLTETNVVTTRVHWDSPRGVVARALLSALVDLPPGQAVSP